jgi:hypothetical protein
LKTQDQFLQEILNIKSKNPEMEIHFCADSNEILDTGWTAHKITNVKISPWFCDNERILTDEDEIKEHFENMADYELPEKEIKSHIDARYESEVKMAICVFTHAG